MRREWKLEKKINRCISFKQNAWLKEWIDFNTEKRAKSDNDFKKDLFKLMNNAVFGKTMENVGNHIGFELITSPQRFENKLLMNLTLNIHI